jgi:hypothetical protein
VSSQDGSGRHLLDGCSSTRTRKVEGSNPSSGSKAAGQSTCAVPRRSSCLPLDHPLLVTRPSERSAPLRYVGVRLADTSPVDGPPSSAHDGRNCENQRLDRPCGAGCAFARIPETSQRLRRPIHISFNGRAHSGLRPNHHRPRGNLTCTPALSPDRRSRSFVQPGQQQGALRHHTAWERIS